MNEKKEPIHKIRLGRITVSIWENISDAGVPWCNVTVTRSWRDGDKFGNSTTYSRDDLLFAMKGMDMAYGWIWEYEQSARQKVANG